MTKALTILGELRDEDVAALVRLGEVLSVSAGQRLIKAGEPITAIYLVLDGEFRIEARDGKIIAKVLTGEVLGEMSLVESVPPSVSVVTARPSRVLSIDQAALTQAIAHDDAFAARFYRAIAVFLSRRLRATVTQLGYGEENRFDPDEMEDDLLNVTGHGGERFRRLVQSLIGGTA